MAEVSHALNHSAMEAALRGAARNLVGGGGGQTTVEATARSEMTSCILQQI